MKPEKDGPVPKSAYGDASAVHARGVTAFREGRMEEAAAAFQRAAMMAPDIADFHLNLGVALKALGRLGDSVACTVRAIAIRPDYAEAHFNLGNVRQQLGDIGAAAASFRRAIELKPDYAEADNNLGHLLDTQGRHDEAAAAYRRALRARPGFVDAINNLGNALLKMHRLDEAVDCFRHALDADPDNPRLHLNLGGTLQDEGRLDEALACYDKALSLAADCADAHLRRAAALLLGGRFEEGWAAYEWRWKSAEHGTRIPPPPGPPWDGSSVDGGRVLLWTEQGFGDAIQFARFAPLVAARGGRVTVACSGPLMRLFGSIDAIDGIIARDGEPPPCDAQAPLMGLAGIFGTTLAAIPADVPYLAAEPALAAKWRGRMAEPDAFKAGLVWAGNREHRNDRNRSLPVELLEPLLDVPGASFFSLQVGEAAAELTRLPAGSVRDLSPAIADFADTAAAIANLDLIISVDTAVAHLAGALARPVWVLLPFAADWRWLLNRGDSPWYPTARLFRQQAPGDWPGAIKGVREALRRAVAAAASLRR